MMSDKQRYDAHITKAKKLVSRLRTEADMMEDWLDDGDSGEANCIATDLLMHKVLEQLVSELDAAEKLERWAGEFRDRLRALDEAGPYGWVPQRHSDGQWFGGYVVNRRNVEELRETLQGFVQSSAERGIRARYRIVPLYAGTPEEVEDE